MKLKRKSLAFQVKEITESGEFSGYGSVFNVKDAYGDIVIPGAFARTLDEWGAKGKLPKMLWQHDTREPIGVYKLMKEDQKGLYVEGKILVDAGATEKRAHEHMKAGSIDGLSIGYTLFPGGLEYDKEQDAYLLKQINLWEVSPVTFPANVESTVDAVKSMLENPKELERTLREAGLTRSQAKGLMSRGYEGLRDLREADCDEDQMAVAKSLSNALAQMRGKDVES